MTPMRALIWKEWRQQRMIFLVLTALAVVVLLAVSIFNRTRAPGTLGPEIQLGLVAMVWLGMASLLAANSFSGERDDRSEAFAQLLPLSLGKMFWVKIAVSMILLQSALLGLALLAAILYGLPSSAGDIEWFFVAQSLFFFILSAVIALYSSGAKTRGAFRARVAVSALTALIALAPAAALFGPPSGAGGLADHAGTSYAFVATMVVLLILSSVAAVSSSGAGALGTFLAGIIASALLALASWQALAATSKTWPWGGEHTADAAFLFLIPTLAVGLALISAWRLWSRPSSTRPRWVAGSTAAALLCVLLPCVPAAGCWAYVTVFAPVTLFVNRDPFSEGIGVTRGKPSPDGIWIPFECRYPGWGQVGGRVVLLNTRTGETHWVSRFKTSGLTGWPENGWSPGGRLLLDGYDRLLVPAPWRTYREHPTLWILDPATGERKGLNELCPALAEMRGYYSALGWVGEDTVVLLQGNSLLLFADINKNTLVRRTLGRVASMYSGNYWQKWWCTSRGVLSWYQESSPASAKRLLQRISPAMDEPEDLTQRLPVDDGAVSEVSADGRKIIYCTGAGQRVLVDLETGSTQEIPLPVPPGERPPPNWMNPVIDARPSPSWRYCEVRLVAVTDGGTKTHGVKTYIVDLKTGQAQPFSAGQIQILDWLNDERLLLAFPYGKYWIADRDGTGLRPLLKGQRLP